VTGTEAPVYVQCGLRLRSEVELHLPVSLGGEWDVDVNWGADIDDTSEPPEGEVFAASDSADGWWYRATSTPTRHVVRFRNCGEVTISNDLTQVEVRRDPSGRSELLPILMAGTVSALLLTLRGATVLHASAVMVDGTALAFVGQSGRGKSTLAALMCLDGAELVTDDVLTVDPGPPVTCLGGASELRLREAAAPIADSRPDGTTRATADSRLAVSLDRAPLQPHPLSAIVVPAPSRTATEIEIRLLPPSTALFWILSFPRVHGWCRADVLSRDFAVLSQLVNRVPVYDVTVPWGPPFSPLVARSLSTLASDEAGTSRTTPTD
jgi:hypothetical protein